MNSHILCQIKEESLKNYPFEACGVIAVQNKDVVLFPLKNTSKSPLDSFELNNYDVLNIKKSHEIIGIYHSHTSPNHSEGFSELDKEFCDKTLIPYYMYNVSLDKHYNIMPKNYKPQYLMKPFIWGVYDCYALVRNYYKHHFNIDMYDYPRDETFYTNPGTLILDNFKNEGFIEIEDQMTIRRDDLLVFCGAKQLPQHFGVYQGNGQMIHHLINKYSVKESIGAFGKKKTLVIRHVTKL